jgi:phosphoserine aminotransferase
MKKYNFYAGPAILPETVLQQSSKAVIELDHIGLSLIEISHRSKDFQAVLDEAQALVKELLNLSDEYKVLFLHGGASMQFCMIPYNLLDQNETAVFTETGVWAKKAIKEAKIFGNVQIIASSADKNFNYIPKNYEVPRSAKYFHVTTNNTIYGTQLYKMPESSIPMVGDMSSDIFSRQFDASKFDLIYAGAQKNMGASGVTLVIIKESILGRVNRAIPTILDYRTHIKDNSLFNTPCTFAIYVAMVTLRWLKENGGLAAIEKHNNEKAAKLYEAIDSNSLFAGTVAKEDRSRMNVCFKCTKSELEEEFLNYTKSNGIVGIKGHRSTGGFRASIYNAMSMEGIQVLIDCMKEFERKHAS